MPGTGGASSSRCGRHATAGAELRMKWVREGGQCREKGDAKGLEGGRSRRAEMLR